MASDVSALLVMTTFPDQVSAESMALLLVTEQLAACVSVLAPCQSIFRWKGNVDRSTEIPLLIKTTDARYTAIEQAICAAHPYEMPEILAIPVADGLPDYLAWVLAETQEDGWPSL